MGVSMGSVSVVQGGAERRVHDRSEGDDHSLLFS